MCYLTRVRGRWVAHGNRVVYAHLRFAYLCLPVEFDVDLFSQGLLQGHILEGVGMV